MTTALSGSLYTTTNGYAGPGYNTGNDVYSIGTYGAWQTSAWTNSQASFETNTDGWEQWFETNYPNIERFVYLCDEDGCNNTPTLTTMLGYMSNVTGVRKNLHTMATQPLHCVVSTTLSDPTSQWPYGDGTSGQNQRDANTILGSEPTRRLFAYGTNRPGTGSTALEDEGVAMRELPWSQYKKSVDRWFVWEGTNYYNTYALTNTNVFVTATTFGNPTTNDPSYGLIGGSGSNGNGVLFYPGTDYYYPSYNYGVTGPIASIRLKEWRRGIQDVDYIILAKAINPSSVSTIVSNMVPNALWENVCGDPPGCTYYTRDTTWSYNPNDWESARSQLAHIIDGQ